jgi:glycerol-3-phosphate dehydrogenase
VEQSNFAFTDRDELLRTLRREDTAPWDLIIVGGGITGVGVLREAARRGYRALLVEQRDFSWGTSSRSSKMVHGGLRYLASGDYKLTRHSLTERERILHEAPGLVERMGYYFTLRKKTFPNRLAMSIVLTIYDWIAGIRDHRYCSNRELLEAFPGLANDNLKGACYYTDAVTDDSRLVLRVLQEALLAGGSAINYLPVKQLLLENGDVQGVLLESPDNGEIYTVRAPVVINATGAWADHLRNEVNPEKRVRPLRGSHLVLPRETLPVSSALALLHPEDKRAVFIFPWEGATVVGTTDLDHTEELNTEASITAKEVNYLLAVVQRQFPQLPISRNDVISTYSGVRPVIGSDEATDPSKERRDHAVWSDRGLITVSGGKLTTFRLIALDAINAAAARLPDANEAASEEVFTRSALSGKELVPADPAWGERLLGRYGTLAPQVLETAPLAERQCLPGTGFCLAECRWAIRREAVIHLDDLLLRRTRLGQLLPSGGEALFPALQAMFSEELGWDDQQWQAELVRYRDIWRNHYSLPVDGPATSSRVSQGD